MAYLCALMWIDSSRLRDWGTQIMVQSDCLGVASENAVMFDDQTLFALQVAYFEEGKPAWYEVDA